MLIENWHFICPCGNFIYSDWFWFMKFAFWASYYVILMPFVTLDVVVWDRLVDSSGELVRLRIRSTLIFSMFDTQLYDMGHTPRTGKKSRQARTGPSLFFTRFGLVKAQAWARWARSIMCLCLTHLVILLFLIGLH